MQRIVGFNLWELCWASIKMHGCGWKVSHHTTLKHFKCPPFFSFSRSSLLSLIRSFSPIFSVSVLSEIQGLSLVRHMKSEMQGSLLAGSLFWDIDYQKYSDDNCRAYFKTQIIKDLSWFYISFLWPIFRYCNNSFAQIHFHLIFCVVCVHFGCLIWWWAYMAS